MSGIDSYTKLMLHGDGTHGSTTILDSALSPKSLTAYGAASLSNAQSKFGATSMKFNPATSDYVTAPHSADFDFGAGDFTIDGWIYQLSNAAPMSIVARERAATYPGFIMGYGTAGSNVYMSSNGTSWDIAGPQSLGTPVINDWSHVEVGRSGNTFYAFRDGVLISTWTSSLALAASSNPLSIGSCQAGTYMNGYISELRISKGICRHTAAFTPETAPYSVPAGVAPTYGQVVAEVFASNQAYVDLVDPYAASYPCDHYQLEFIHAVSDIETPPNAQSGALLTAYVSVDGGQTFDTGPYYFTTGLSNFPGEANRYFLPPFALGLPQTLNMGLRLSADTGDTAGYGASGIAKIFCAGGNTQYTSEGIKGAIGGNSNQSMPQILRPAQAAGSGYISGTTLTINEAFFGAFSVGQIVDGSGIAPNTVITSGSGGVGTYTVSISQNVGQTNFKAVAATHAYFPSNGSAPFHWGIPIDYAGHYDGSPGQRPNAFRLDMSGGGNTTAIIESGTFRLRRMG